MCTLAIYFRVFTAFPVIVAANRDEFLSRPTEGPALLDERAGIFGGRDGVCGGTWLGVNRSGMAAALLNRRSDDPPDPRRRSRGLLCLDALGEASARSARRRLQRVAPGEYNPFNLLVADAAVAWVATNHGGTLRITELPAGIHLLTNLDVDDPTCPRIAASHRLFAELTRPGAPPPESLPFREELRRILATHDTPLDPRGPEIGNSLCVHAGAYGTRSSTLLFLDAAGRWQYLHADGPPCRVGHEPRHAAQSLLAQERASSP